MSTAHCAAQKQKPSNNNALNVLHVVDELAVVRRDRLALAVEHVLLDLDALAVVREGGQLVHVDVARDVEGDVGGESAGGAEHAETVERDHGAKVEHLQLFIRNCSTYEILLDIDNFVGPGPSTNISRNSLFDFQLQLKSGI